MTAELYDAVIGMCEKWKRDATTLATLNPFGFLIVMGIPLSEYIAAVNKLEDAYTRIRERERERDAA